MVSFRCHYCHHSYYCCSVFLFQLNEEGKPDLYYVTVAFEKRPRATVDKHVSLLLYQIYTPLLVMILSSVDLAKAFITSVGVPFLRVVYKLENDQVAFTCLGTLLRTLASPSVSDDVLGTNQLIKDPVGTCTFKVYFCEVLYYLCVGHSFFVLSVYAKLTL